MLAVACRTAAPPSQVPLQGKTEIREKIVDVPAVQDSAAIMAFFECDSNNRVILSRYNQLMSDYVSLSSSIVPIEGGMKISAQIKTNHPATKAVVRDSIVYQDVPVYVKGDTVEVVKPLTPFQQFIKYSGIAAWVILIAYAAFKFYNFSKR